MPVLDRAGDSKPIPDCSSESAPRRPSAGVTRDPIRCKPERAAKPRHQIAAGVSPQNRSHTTSEPRTRRQRASEISASRPAFHPLQYSVSGGKQSRRIRSSVPNNIMFALNQSVCRQPPVPQATSSNPFVLLIREKQPRQSENVDQEWPRCRSWKSSQRSAAWSRKSAMAVREGRIREVSQRRPLRTIDVRNVKPRGPSQGIRRARPETAVARIAGQATVCAITLAINSVIDLGSRRQRLATRGAETPRR